MEMWRQPLMLLIIALAFLVPAFITFLFGYDPSAIPSRRGRVWVGLAAWALGFGIDAAMIFALHKLLFNRWNILQTIREIVSLRFTYQDILPFCQILLLSTLTSIMLGMGFRVLFRMAGGRLQGWRRICALILLAATGTADAMLYQLGASGQSHIVINEIAAYNDSIKFAHDRIYDYRAGDYLELYNTGSLACMTDGLYLSKDPDKLDQVAVRPERIPEKGYMIIALETPALLAGKEGGDTFYLSDSQGRIIDQLTTQAVHVDHSWCRASDGADEWRERAGTPGADNELGRGRLEETPVFSHASGFYDEPFELEISAKTADGHMTIHYTLDASVPTAESAVYTGPIRVYDRSAEPNVYRNIPNVTSGWQDTYEETPPVDKAFVVRAVAVGEDGSVSEVVNASYFVGLDQYKDRNVLSIIVDPEDLWGEEGIYITGREYDEWYLGDRTGKVLVPNYQKGGRDYEVEADVTCFSDAFGFSQKAGLRIAGASSRGSAVKRFNLNAKEKYSGSDVFDAQIFEGVSSHKLSLRPGNGNALIPAMVSDRAVTVQRSHPAVVFLNGEYWYHAYLMEGYDERYFEEYYHMNSQNLLVPDQISNLFNGELDFSLKEDLYAFLAGVDMRNGEAYQQLCQRVDMDSYIDYLCIRIYCDDIDFDEYKNAVWWRSIRKNPTPYEDGRWRFGLYDLDAVEWSYAEDFGLKTKAQKNSFVLKSRFVGSIQDQPLYASVKVNPDFQKQFTLTMMDLMNMHFRYENAAAFIDAFSVGNDLMTEERQRFFKDFFRERPEYMPGFLAEEFGLTGTVERIALSANDPQAGFIRLNTITPDLTLGEWTGEYFTDFPLTVTAVANEGYVFEKWEGDAESADAQISVSLQEGGTTLRAVFRKAE